MRSRAAALLAFLLAALAPLPAPAGSLGISPTRLELGPSRGADTVAISNTGREPVLVQVRAYAWAEGGAPEDLRDTRDVLALPAMAEIAPGQRQLVRVAARPAAAGPSERAYRVVVSEVPPETPGAGEGVRFSVRLSIPVFVTPKGAVAAPRWEASRQPDGVLAIRVANEGTAHLQLWKLAFRPDAGGSSAGGPPVEVERPAYLLAGESRSWDASKLPRGTQRVRVTADANVGAIDILVPVGPGPRP